MCLLIILILQLYLGSTESESCQVSRTMVESFMDSCNGTSDKGCRCCNILPQENSEGSTDQTFLLQVRSKGTQSSDIEEQNNALLVTIGKDEDSEQENLIGLCRTLVVSSSANCDPSDPEDSGDASFQSTSWDSEKTPGREDIPHYTAIAILSFLVCVLGFTVAVLAVALYRTRQTKRTARQPLPPPPGPPVLQVANHDYSTVYEELPNMDGVKTQGEQNRLTENHEGYTLSGLINTDRGPNRTKMREAVTIKEVQERGDTATSSSEEHMYSVLEKEIEEVRSDGTYSIDKEGTYHVLEECLQEKDQDQKEVEDHYHVLDPEAVSAGEDSTSTEEQAC